MFLILGFLLLILSVASFASAGTTVIVVAMIFFGCLSVLASILLARLGQQVIRDQLLTIPTSFVGIVTSITGKQRLIQSGKAFVRSDESLSLEPIPVGQFFER